MKVTEAEEQDPHNEEDAVSQQDAAGEQSDKLGSLLKAEDRRGQKKRGQANKADAEDETHQRKKRSSFITAPLKRKPFSGDSAASPPPSFHTAFSSPQASRQPTRNLSPTNDDIPATPVDGEVPRSSNGSTNPPEQDNANSKTALLDQDGQDQMAIPPDPRSEHLAVGPTPKANAPGLVKFNTDNLPQHAENRAFAKLDKNDRRRSWRRMRKGEHCPGSIVKAEKMLVRVEQTMKEVPEGYDENLSIKLETRIIEKWREFVVVCRESTNDDAEFCLQMYKTRVIPAKAETHVAGKFAHEVPLSHRKTKVNLYSSLDKTLVVWAPSKNGSLIYILRARSAASAVEWYTFIRQSLGWKRSTNLQLNVPDLSVALQLKNPFGELEGFIGEAREVKTDQAVLKTMEAEKAVASMIIQQAIESLQDNPEWSNVLEAWLATEKIGLAWKRYDRLEWVHGAN